MATTFITRLKGLFGILVLILLAELCNIFSRSFFPIEKNTPVMESHSQVKHKVTIIKKFTEDITRDNKQHLGNLTEKEFMTVTDRPKSSFHQSSSKNSRKTLLPLCPLISPFLVGRNNITEEEAENLFQDNESSFELRMRKAGLKEGGKFQPKHCRSRNKVTIVVPFRKREDHLIIFLHYMHPFLQRQQLDYIIIIVEQSGTSSFNRGMLLNIGFLESKMFQEQDRCYIFHDVDMLPEDDHNAYVCPEDGMSRQMAFLFDEEDLESLKDPLMAEYFGGVTAFTANDFKLVNGFSNIYWGWGSEDDDLRRRVKLHNITVMRSFNDQPSLVHLARYRTIYHHQQKPNPDRYLLFKEGPYRMKFDGLSDIRYKRKKLEFKSLYTHILVDVTPNLENVK